VAEGYVDGWETVRKTVGEIIPALKSKTGGGKSRTWHWIMMIIDLSRKIQPLGRIRIYFQA